MRRKLTRPVVLAVALFGLVALLAQAAYSQSQDWYVAATMDGPIAFHFDGEYLFLNTTTTQYGPQTYNLHISGTWGACGTVGGGVLTADPYAQFEILSNSPGAAPVGRLHWLSGVSPGYTTNLLLGYSFAGDGAQTYTYRTSLEDPVESEVTGTLVVLYSYESGWEGSGWAASHAFSATYVPEPPALFALLGGCGVLALRRRR